MSQSQFILQQGVSRELDAFPQVIEFGLKKNNSIQLGSFETKRSQYMQIYFVVDGRFEWLINGKKQVLYPEDTVFVMPGQEIGGAKGFFSIGTFIYLKLRIGHMGRSKGVLVGDWSRLSENESLTLGEIFKYSNTPVLKLKEAGLILQEFYAEICNQEIGYLTRAHYMLDSLLIILGRHTMSQSSSRRDFPQTFTKLEHALRNNLDHQWTVEEMAAMMGLGSTAFTEKVKNYTGFTPVHYLINLRISEAIKRLKKENVSITEVALGTGFYSSQHFSSTFKKLTGYTPGEFRKKNIAK